MNNNLTNEKPFKAITVFWIPMIIGNMFNQLYSIVDTIVVGNFISSNALAAVGTSGIIMSVINGAAIGLAVGASVVVSQNYGAKKYKDTRGAINTSIILFLIVGLIGSIVGQLIRTPLLNLLGTPSEYYSYAQEYLIVIFIGIVFTILYNVFNQISTALGDSKTPMIMLLIASVINVLLDLVFTLVFNLGVRGVALATIIGQGFAACTCYMIIRKKMNDLPIEGKNEFKFDSRLVKPILTIGLPAVFQNMISSSGSLAMQRLYNSFGTVTVAAFTAANKIDGFAMSPLVSLGSAISTYGAQNIGAKRYDRLNEGLKVGAKLTIITCLITGVIIFIFSSQLLSLFIDMSDVNAIELISIGTEYLHVAVFSYAVMSAMFIFTGLLKGAGDAKTVFWCSIADLLGRAAFAYAMAGFIGRYALWLSYPFGWACSLAISLPVYFRGKWKNIQVLSESE
ncbi:MAG: MATE family efflux transporter [Traorella sp.]